MYNIEWDCDINGILLTAENSDLPSPRPVFYEELDLLDILSYEELNPENIYLDYNDYLNIYENIINKLTNFEECVFVLKIKGFSSNDISILLDKNEKSINNAICRIKLKVKDLYV